MEPMLRKAKEYCEHIGALCGASCSLLYGETVAELEHSDKDLFCKECGGCDFVNTMHYGCSQSYRWNGKYVFYCPKGFVFIAVSLLDSQRAPGAGMLMGPISMGESGEAENPANSSGEREITAHLPEWSTAKVRHAEEILSAVAGTVSGGNASGVYGSFAYEQEKQLSDLYEIKNEWKNSDRDSQYLIQSEKQLNSLIENKDKEGAQQLLNEMLGYIFFKGKADFSTIKARIVEMLVLISRSAIDAGAGTEEILLFNEGNLKKIGEISSLEELSAWITVIMHRFIQYSFDFNQVKHSDVLHKIMQYVKANYDTKITLDDIAAHVYLSRSYISSMFKEEMGETLFSYINRVRVEKSKVLLLRESVSLVKVGGLCGFEDQSYFTKVFKGIVGVSPKKFRDSRGKIKI